MDFNCCGVLPARKTGVSTGPGATQFTVIPRAPRSFARIRVICSRAPFDMVNRSAIGRTVDALVSAVEMNIIRPPEIIKEKPSVTRLARKTEGTLLTWLHLFCHGLREEQRPLHVGVERGVKFFFARVGQPRVAHHGCVENQDVWWPKTPQTLVQ